MKPSALIPREIAARKPRHGDPCNRCGMCCMTTRCQLGEHLFGEGGCCPALIQDSPTTFACGIVADPELAEELREAAKLIIYAGDGCDARFNGEWVNKKYHWECSIRDAKNKRKRDAALKLWGIKP